MSAILNEEACEAVSQLIRTVRQCLPWLGMDYRDDDSKYGRLKDVECRVVDVENILFPESLAARLNLEKRLQEGAESDQVNRPNGGRKWDGWLSDADKEYLRQVIADEFAGLKSDTACILLPQEELLRDALDVLEVCAGEQVGHQPTIRDILRRAGRVE